MKYDPETGEILEINQPPTGATDAIAMQHDVDYDVCSNREEKYGENLKKCKHKGDKKWLRLLTQFLQTEAVGSCGCKKYNQC